ncbi:glycosyltransferase family 2 protein [Streptomyces sp. AV19]|uniref:glycosyltransferase family 2 protein n=1 Tax=Streptomyces sp. AV19 TaxID=2793068 RepID=UPI0018FE9776|nr:glycosyltransferase family 2 protein [Streptomyces sp. AV19]MBH1932744.1 glycosyltransferase family 2 protein [Streptomyces sp. AV19]MDG4531415.1 glycosyltransferase family 2 protein [Streptomyces sp. AV19]
MSSVTVNESGTPGRPNAPGTLPPGLVSVIVIGYDDAAHVADAVRSALAQDPAVAEVIAVDDASTDGTAAVLDRLAARHPRLRVIHRRVNSGGCGTPRNEGLRAARTPYVMFLDSDDVLPEGAAEALLGAALRHGVPVAAGLCVRRELPQRIDTRWQPGLYRTAALHPSPEHHPALLHDTLCVNKLYARAFLTEHGVLFPEGRYPYEDFVFSARLLAAGPAVATVPDTVYVWHVRRRAARPSLSLDRDRIANWHARVRAHRRGEQIYRAAGRERLALAARVKFLDHDLRIYVRELPRRDAVYRHAWWRAARACLAGYDEAELAAARAPARWIARVVLAAPAPRDLDRLAQLAARPARLLPPYAAVSGGPVWADDLPAAVLDGLAAAPTRRLPVTVDATLRLLLRADLTLHVHDLYGRLAAARPHTAEVELRPRGGSWALVLRTPLHPEGPGWSARLRFGLGPLASYGTRTWEVRVRLHCAHGGVLRTAARATGPLPRGRVALPSLRYGVLLLRPHATGGGALAMRVVVGVGGALTAVARRLRWWG